MPKFSKQILKSFKNLCEADDGGSPKGQPTVQNAPQEQMQLYHGQGGMAAYNTRTQSNIPQWMYTGIPAYTAPNGTVVIPPDPRTGLFLPNMLPGVYLINIPDPVTGQGVYLWTFDYSQLGGMTPTNAYNLIILNMIMNPYYLFNNYGDIGHVEESLINIGAQMQRLSELKYPGIYDGDGDLFVQVFFPPMHGFDTQAFDFINQFKNTFASGRVDFQNDYIVIPDRIQT